MPRFIPPAGAPLKMADIVSSVKTAASSSDHATECFAAVARRFQVKHVFGTLSGRAGLWLILRSLHRLNPERDVVAVPAYTCFSVPAAIARAGLKIFPLDVDPRSFELDLSQLAALPDNKLLCVIACNLFGFPSELSTICKAAQTRGAYVIDDAAQAFGAARNGRYAGTFGDVGLYSLGRGKALGSIEGGLIVTNSEQIAATLQAEAADLGEPSLAHGVWLLCEMLAYSVLLRPNLFWIPNSMPFLKLGTTEFNPSFALGRIPALSAALLPELLGSLDEVNGTRRANAKALREMMEGSSKFEFPVPAANTRACFVRLPVLGCDKELRDRAVATLRSAGIGATAFYPSAICDIAGVESYMSQPDFHREKAESLSQRLFTLPVGPFVTTQDLERITNILGTIETENS